MAKQQQQQKPAQPAAKKVAPAPARKTEKRDSIFSSVGNDELIYGKKNFVIMGIGLLLVLVGLAAMTGGAMPDPNKWEPERIYSPVRITLAHFLMVSGFIVVMIGIFKKSRPAAEGDNTDLYA